MLSRQPMPCGGVTGRMRLQMGKTRPLASGRGACGPRLDGDCLMVLSLHLCHHSCRTKWAQEHPTKTDLHACPVGRYALIGNAVSVPVGKWIGEQLQISFRWGP